ncbi:MAG: excinuclease ABC subunit UvrA [Planctomycetota bacterium]
MSADRGEGTIRIRGARQNNLAGVDVDLPRHALVAVTGVSGSGKSSLAFDTLYREGQRRFLETLSAYARQFFGGLSKPDVESIEGLSPAIAVDQKSVARSARSTVGTLTEIVDHLRVLFARAGVAHSPWCDRPVESRTPESIVQELLAERAGARVTLAAPLIKDRKGSHRALFEDLQKKGFVRARVDGALLRIEDAPELERYKSHTIEVVIDRIKIDGADPARLREAIDQALELGEQEVVAIFDDGERTFSTSRVCPETGRELPVLEPRLFSFNSPHGACPKCQGLGVLRQPSAAAVVRDGALSIRDGALAVTRASGGALLFPQVDFKFLARVGEEAGFDLDTPWNDLSERGRRAVLHGTGEARFEDTMTWNGAKSKGSASWNRRYRGVLTELARAWERGSRKKMVERFLSDQVCPECAGSRLNMFARFVRLGTDTNAARLHELTALPVDRFLERLDALVLTERQRRIGGDLLNEIRRRAQFLLEVGLSYLTLERAADTLSGGEAQRIRLAAQLGAGLQGVLYVLDEPSIGLHARDHDRLLGALARLRDAGNTVVVVEHDENTLRSADWLIDVGPGAGRRGGHIVASGPPSEVARADSPTGRLLRDELEIPAPSSRRAGSGVALEVRGARGFNLKSVDARFPLGTLTVVTGVSGSGKSTLVERTLRRAIERHLGRETPDPAPYSRILGLEHLDDLVAIDAAPIGRTPRSNPATYTGVMGPIRDLFASLPESKVRGYDKSRFSFNTAGGRCEECQGAGVKELELQFLAPVTVPCEECGGARFQTETLDVRFRGRSIADVLALPVEEAAELFKDLPLIARPLALMVEVGLGYLTLGQPSPTLSGGEAQRIKLVTHLAKRARGHVLYLLDEPTTGLHMEDVGRLVGALQRLVDMGHSALVIEHNLELVQAADHVIDLGPEGGAAGGELLFAGTPEEAAQTDTPTGHALRDLASKRTRVTRPLPRDTARVEERAHLRVVGARTHNLQNIDVDLPHRSLTVITGPSGSGKSSLALDTIHTEGRRRFVESLSTYARQFLGTKDRPPVDRIDGLGPSVAVEAGGGRSHPRSTIATTTELHDQLRVLWARAGTAHCPEHGEVLEPSDPSRIARRILSDAAEDGAKAKGWVLAPVLRAERAERAGGTGEAAPSADADGLAQRARERAPSWIAAGFVRVLVDGVEVRLDAQPDFAGAAAIDLVVDRLGFDAESRARLADAVEQAATITHGRVSVQIKGGPRREYSVSGACTTCGFQLDGPLQPRHFSFNTHVGACKRCHGLGAVVRADVHKLITDPDAPLTEGAIGGKLGRYLVKGKGYYEMLLREVARAHRIDLDRPFSRLTEKQRALLLHGEGARAEYHVEVEKSMKNLEVAHEYSAGWTGLCGHIDAWHAKAEDPEWAAVLEEVMTRALCPACEGERLAPAYRFVTVGQRRLPLVLALTVADARAWMDALRLRKALAEPLAPVLTELRSRLSLLERVGLGYLALDRSTATLSGGEARRVRLAASLGSELVGVTYVLDEPTVGLHPSDIDRLAGALEGLRDRGNTVLVVEHDGELMRRADWIVDMGPGAGRLGGQVVVSGPPAVVRAHPTSGTARYLRGELSLAAMLAGDAEADRAAAPGELTTLPTPIVLTGAKVNNLKGVDLTVRFGELLGVCGPSGSGKSTLVLDTLVPALAGEAAHGRWRGLQSPAGVRTVVVDAAPIGRTPHSVPATYTGLLEPLRELYARTPEARMRGMTGANFSFNSPKGRCAACDGLGATLVEMQFLADLWLTCEECNGQRYRPETLAVTWRAKTIADVLAMPVDEAYEFFEAQPKLRGILGALRDVGLGYISLGQSSTTLSGGEAQRIKLASELQRADGSSGRGSRSVFVLDEPSTGLAATDTVHLARAIARLARAGNAVVMIEHDTDLLEVCDRLIELGPGGGDEGGRLIASGTPRELARNEASITGPWLFRSVAAATTPSAKRAANAAKKATKKATVKKGAVQGSAKAKGAKR